MSCYKGKTVIVTGADGFVGTHLCRRLRHQGANVIRFTSRENIKDRNALRMIGKADILYHLAAKTEVGASLIEPYDTFDTNVTGTLNVLDHCRKMAIPLVYASTDKVYGDVHSVSCHESQVLRADTDPYSQSKKVADELVQLHAKLYHIQTTILRPCNIYGPGQLNETTLITGSILKLLRKEMPVVHDRSQLREWIYIDDMIEAYLLVGENTMKKTGLALYNVGSGFRLGAKGVVQTLLGYFANLPCEYYKTVNSPIAYSNEIGDQGLDSKRFHVSFPTWKPTLFEDGLKKTLEWYKANYSGAVS